MPTATLHRTSGVSLLTIAGAILMMLAFPSRMLPSQVAEPPVAPGVSFAVISLASGQTVRLKALNLGGSLGSSPGTDANQTRVTETFPSCTVTFEFYGQKGSFSSEVSP